ncbi:MAG: hypothetical protein KAS63_06545 [Candidatus Heimdallarchaeota archaeon]|nr:hypothetical protein [Candidatus Heimdallarchaeota archaeon]MCK4955002.1 hypothetical protein [Candidatus Heimdallarchaeota archaeon]
MNANYRKTDSLAYATGSFKTILEEVNLRWTDNTSKIIELGKQVDFEISKALQKRQDTKQLKQEIISNLSNLGKLYSSIDEINKEKIDLMIEMEGLDFPLKTPRKILKQCKEEKKIADLLENFTSNLSKTVTFIENGITEEELIENSLNSFITTFNEFKEIVDLGSQLNSHLEEELDKEHKKARKYLGIV